MAMAFTPHKVDEIPNVMIHTHGVSSPSALGLAGGRPGATNYLLIKRNTNLESVMRGGRIPEKLSDLEGDSAERPPPFIYTRLVKGDVFECGGGGGGGFGDPIERSAELVLLDLQKGLVSPADATASYGVVLDPANGGVDAAATSAERQKMRVARHGDGDRELASQFKPDGRPQENALCSCGQILPDAMSASARPRLQRDVPYEVEVFNSVTGVRRSQYSLRESLCPTCGGVVDSRVCVPQAEP
jgi:N-methylhydantoinase B